MTESRSVRFDTWRELENQFSACIGAAQRTLDLFDPDFAPYPLGALDVDTLLRAFMARGGRLRLALHNPAHIERHYPRFTRLLRDYSHLCECRRTPTGLRHLTDSFCIGDGRDLVRRFHSDHARGAASFGEVAETELPQHRFDAIWLESRTTLQPTISGL